jgi:hypothetical protein
MLEPDVRKLTILRSDGPSRTYREVAVIDGPQPIGRWLDPTAVTAQEHHYVVTLTDAGGKVSEANEPAIAKSGRYLRRLNCGGGEVMDLDGIAWEADRNLIDGLHRWLTSQPIRHAPAELQAVFQSERWADGGLRYRFSAPPGRYQVVLLFAETNAEFAANGGRTFDVVINGNKEHDNVDIFREAGANIAWQLLSTVRVDDARQIVIELQRRNAGPALKGIEIRGVD